MTYPDGIDCLWLACDRDDRVAAFITAGCAPIPSTLLSTPRSLEAGEACDDLDEICDAESLLREGRPDSFLALARRGLHVYDWQDIHRRRSECIDAYELVAKPGVARRLVDLPASLAALAQTFRFDDLSFAQSPAIDPRTLTACAQGHGC